MVGPEGLKVRLDLGNGLPELELYYTNASFFRIDAELKLGMRSLDLSKMVVEMRLDHLAACLAHGLKWKDPSVDAVKAQVLIEEAAVPISKIIGAVSDAMLKAAFGTKLSAEKGEARPNGADPTAAQSGTGPSASGTQ